MFLLNCFVNICFNMEEEENRDLLHRDKRTIWMALTIPTPNIQNMEKKEENRDLSSNDNGTTWVGSPPLHPTHMERRRRRRKKQGIYYQDR